MTYTDDEVARKLEKLRLLEEKQALKEGLPHLHGYPFYRWAKLFFDSTNRYNFLCAANQISKSSTQIRKSIHWATEPKLWKKLWRRTRPFQFWYLYPTKEVATIEFEKKWTKEFLPSGKYKTHPQYGWRAEYRNKNIWAIHFNTGVTIYFKTYMTDVSALQTGTVHSVFCDEELPYDLYPELNMRIQAVEGYFHMVFTATLNQAEWFDTMEGKGKNEKFPHAFKQQISMFDCLEYEDGTPSPWTVERINQIINSCGTDAEVQRRVYGKFVSEKGLKYPSFSRTENVKPPMAIPKDWFWYSGVDIGGGGDGHPAAMVFIAVRPDYRYARVVKGWRGDSTQLTTSTDILEKYLELRGRQEMMGEFYDWQSKDFSIVADRNGVPLQKADKGHETGENLLNALFKNGMIDINDTPELKPLVDELSSLRNTTPKKHAKDDFIDALRYSTSRIPFDFSWITGEVLIKKEKPLTIDEQRSQESQELDEVWGVQEEIDAMNELYEEGT